MNGDISKSENANGVVGGNEEVLQDDVGSKVAEGNAVKPLNLVSTYTVSQCAESHCFAKFWQYARMAKNPCNKLDKFIENTHLISCWENGI